MPFIRTFIAIQIPEDIKNEISTFQEELKAAGKGIGWVKPDNIHLTLKFLGSTDEQLIDDIDEKIKDSVVGINQFQIQVQGIGAFPNLKRPRVIWIGANSETDQLGVVVQKLEKNLEVLGFKPENRKFSAHLTVGRVKDNRKINSVLERVKSFSEFDAGTFTVEKIELIKSDLHPAGAIYSPLRKIVL